MSAHDCEVGAGRKRKLKRLLIGSAVIAGLTLLSEKSQFEFAKI
jgi:hypothetical protein